MRLSYEDTWTLMQQAVAAAAEPGQPDRLYAALDHALGRAVGHKLFTMMVLHADSGEAERVYSNMPEAYPVAGRKATQDSPWYQQVIRERRPFLGPTMADVRWAFFDHELIASLGCGSAINLLVQYDGEVLGTVNMLHEEHYYQPDDLATGAPFAALLAPTYLRLRG